MKNNMLTQVTVRVFQNHLTLFSCDIDTKPNERITLESVLSKLNGMAKAQNIKTMQWSLDDEIFKHCNINEFKQACNNVLTDVTIALIKRPQLISSDEEKHEILKQFHESEFFGGHCGQKRMYANIRSKFFWPKLSKDVAKYVSNCHSCKMSKPMKANKEALHLTRTPQRPFDITIIDTVGPLPKSNNGYSSVVTLVCDLTKYLVCIPIADKSAVSVARAIFEQFVLIYGPMSSIRTDMGTEYINETMSELCKLMKIEKMKSTAYHHETLGAIEKNHRLLNEYLRAYLSSNFAEWDVHLRYFTFCYNIAKSTTNDTRYTPYELLFGRQVTLPHELCNGQIDPIYNTDSYVSELKYRLQTAHEDTRTIINKIKLRNKEYHDKNINPLNVKINDRVKLVTEPYDKHKPIYSGPYTIVDIRNENVDIVVNNKKYTVHKNRIRKY